MTKGKIIIDHLKSITMKNLQLLAILLLLFFISCSKEDDADPDDLLNNGSFEVTLSGDISRTLEGEAYFVHGIVTSQAEAENGSTLTVTLAVDEDEDEIITITVGKAGDLDGINTGTYTIDLDADDDEELVNLGVFLNESITIFLGTSGTITLDKVENGRVEGSFSGVVENGMGETMNISGDFTASGITKNL